MQSKKSLISHDATGVSFSFFSPKDAKKMCVRRITRTDSFDLMGNANKGGLYDKAMGPIGFDDTCDTCRQPYRFCPGHFGYIELPFPIYHPLLFTSMYNILKATCLQCHRFRMGDKQRELFKNQLRYIDQHCLVAASEAGDPHSPNPPPPAPTSFDSSKLPSDTWNLVSVRRETVKAFLKASPSKACACCNTQSPSFKKNRDSKIFEKISAKRKAKTEKAEEMLRFLSPLELFTHFQQLWSNETELVNLIWKSGNPTGASLDSQTMETKTLEDDSVMESQEALELETKVQWGGLGEEEEEKAGVGGYRMFFLTVLPVAPNKYRPLNRTNDMLMEHPQNNAYSAILKTARELVLSLNDDINSITGAGVETGDGEQGRADKELAREMMVRNGEADLGKRLELWVRIQENVNYLIDNTHAPIAMNAPPGIKNILEKKEGLFRRNMMGKRVNYAARSVISPDPYLKTNEIGIPLYFAKNLTFPEAVTPLNFLRLKKAVENGPEVWPGANAIEDERGVVVRLQFKTEDQRKALAKTLVTPFTEGKKQFGKVKKVYRHVQNGDVVIMNRQPSLHKPSMMCHKVRVLNQERVLRMHYANCKTYNADFDGDEMNMHFCQDELARAEGYFIANADNQYIAPTNGAPLRGLIQDHIVTAIHLTKRDCFFSRSDFQQMVYTACSEAVGFETRPLFTPVPCILKPTPLWSGKQVITTILRELTRNLPPISFTGKSKVPEKYWGEGTGEGPFYIRDNEFVWGVLEKNQFGNSAYGLVHAIYELYGADFAGRFLTALSRMLTYYLQTKRGFTCSVEDLILVDSAEKARRDLLVVADKAGEKVGKDFSLCQDEDEPLPSIDDPFRLRELMRDRLLRDEKQSGKLDGFMRKVTHKFTSDTIASCLPDGQRTTFPVNNLSLMTVSGAKGSMVNFSQISCLLGQQELEGKRVPRMITGRTLPCFEPYEMSARAGGYVMDRFLTGVRPQEYFFHCMAGREGLIDTAVKTANSGYLQRCLIKHLETLKVCYDQTVRASDGSVIQFRYGEDAIDVSNCQYLKKFDFVAENFDGFLHKYGVKKIPQAVDTASVEVHKRKAQKAKRAWDRANEKYIETDGTFDFYEKQGTSTKVIKQKLATMDPPPSACDPVLGALNPSVCLGAVSDNYEKAVNDFVEGYKNFGEKEKNAATHKPTSAAALRALLYVKYMKSLAVPGESVGVLAGQGIGEPSTQMTLNTFHLAGRGEANVTLGIPRLREIIMTGTTKLPTMTIPLVPSATTEQAVQLAELLTYMTMEEVVKDISVKETLVSQSGTSSSTVFREYFVDIEMDSGKRKAHKVTWGEVERAVEKKFLAKLMYSLRKIKGFKSAAKAPKLFGNTEQHQSFFETGADDEMEDKEEQEELKKMKDKKAMKKKKHADLAGEDAVSEGVMKKKEEMVGYGEDDEAMEGDDEEEEEGPVAVAEEDEEKENFKDMLDTNFLRSYKFYRSGEEEGLRFVLSFPASAPKILMLDLIEREVKKCVVKCIPGITKCFITEYTVPGTSNKVPAIQTEGANLVGVLPPLAGSKLSDLVNFNAIECNDTKAVLARYGVECARNSIVHNINSVFKVYGIGVDYRHLSLVADYMTFGGGYTAMNRIGMANNHSPLLKMSFETTVSFLTTAAQFRQEDRLESPAARIVMGQAVAHGSGAFDVLHNLVKEEVEEESGSESDSDSDSDVSVSD